MITPMSESSRAMSNATFSSVTVFGRNEFLTSGRLIVIFAIPSSVHSYLMSSKSCSLRQVSAMTSRYCISRNSRNRPARPAAWVASPCGVTGAESRPRASIGAARLTFLIRAVSLGQEVSQARDEQLRLFPRHAMPGVRTDPQFRVWQARDRAASDLRILRVTLARDPENRRLDLLQPRRRKHRRR